MTRRKPTGEDVKRALEFAGAYHEVDLSLPTRTMYLGSPTMTADGEEAGVDHRFAEGAIKNLHVLEETGDGPITVVMNCVGGDVYHGLAVYDAIRCSPLKVRVVVRGHAMSMGSVILQAADWRVMGPSATQMLHYGKDFLAGHSKTVEKQAEESRRLNAWMERTYLDRIRQKRPRFTMRELRKLIDHDLFLTAEQSVDLGLADEIG